jgi:pimeloyl-ACP methyl ester carboxylesterase
MKVIVDNLAVEYKDEGQGPVLFLLHGWMDSLKTFDALVAELSTKYRVVRIDLPGFGESEMPKKPWHVADYAKFVADCCVKLNVQPTAFVGHSLGGRIILKGLAEKTLSADKAVLIASAGVADRKTLRNWSFAIIAKAGKAATAIPPFTLLRAKLRTKLYAAAKSDYAGAGAMTPTFLNVIGENLAPLAPLVSVPTLLVWGKSDTTTPIAEGERLRSLMPNAKLEIIEGAGHFVHREKAQEVARLISEFV